MLPTICLKPLALWGGLVRSGNQSIMSIISHLIIIGDLWKCYGKLQVLSEHDSMSHLCDCCLVPVLYI